MARCGETLGGIFLQKSDTCMHGMSKHSLGTGTWWALKYPYWVPIALEWAVGTRDPMSDEGHKYCDFAGRRIPFKRLPELAKAYYGVDHTIDPVRFEALLGRYYKLMGWDNNGVPTEETLLRLGLAECNEAMKAHR